MRRLICAFVVSIWPKQVFSSCGSNRVMPPKDAGSAVLSGSTDSTLFGQACLSEKLRLIVVVFASFFFFTVKMNYLGQPLKIFCLLSPHRPRKNCLYPKYFIGLQEEFHVLRFSLSMSSQFSFKNASLCWECALVNRVAIENDLEWIVLPVLKSSPSLSVQFKN